MYLVLFTSCSLPEGIIHSGRGSSLLSKSFLKDAFADLPKEDLLRGLPIKIKLTRLNIRACQDGCWVPQMNGEVDYVIIASRVFGYRPYHLLLISENENRVYS